MAEKIVLPCDAYNKLMECCICHKTFIDPVAPPCMHVSCRACLANFSNCPLCGAWFDKSQVKKMHYLGGFVNLTDQTPKTACSSCGSAAGPLKNCEHCSTQICPTCIKKHMKTLKQEVTELCNNLQSDILPKLEEHDIKITTIMSESSAMKENLKRELLDINANLIAQIHSLKQRSIDILNDIDKSNDPDGADDLVELDSLLARIDSMLSASSNVVQERDIRKLMQMDSDITKLQQDIETFFAKHASKGKQAIDFSGIKINQDYMKVAAQIECTDMLKKKEF